MSRSSRVCVLLSYSKRRVACKMSLNTSDANKNNHKRMFNKHRTNPNRLKRRFGIIVRSFVLYTIAETFFDFIFHVSLSFVFPPKPPNRFMLVSALLGLFIAVVAATCVRSSITGISMPRESQKILFKHQQQPDGYAKQHPAAAATSQWLRNKANTE